MGTQNSPSLQDARHESSFGDCTVLYGEITPANLALNEVINILRIPGGCKVVDLFLLNEDLDSNGAPTAAMKLGYTPVNSDDGPTANDAYWWAAGQTFLQAAAQNQSRAFPLTLTKDVFVTLTVTAAAATFAAGKIGVKAYVKGVGR